jgi:putative membrane protein
MPHGISKGGKMCPGEHFWWGGWWMFPMAMPLVMIIAALVVVYFLFGRDSYRPPCWDCTPSGREPEKPHDILKKRYAGGEIKKEEIEQMKKDLS